MGAAARFSGSAGDPSPDATRRTREGARAPRGWGPRQMTPNPPRGVAPPLSALASPGRLHFPGPMAALGAVSGVPSPGDPPWFVSRPLGCRTSRWRGHPGLGVGSSRGRGPQVPGDTPSQVAPHPSRPTRRPLRSRSPAAARPSGGARPLIGPGRPALPPQRRRLPSSWPPHSGSGCRGAGTERRQGAAGMCRDPGWGPKGVTALEAALP